MGRVTRTVTFVQGMSVPHLAQLLSDTREPDFTMWKFVIHMNGRSAMGPWNDPMDMKFRDLVDICLIPH